MADETKVGLVVGLGFIVCFAMILANRSATARIEPQMPYRLFTSPPEGVPVVPRSDGATLPETDRRSEEPPRAVGLPEPERPLHRSDDGEAAPGNPDAAPRPSILGDPERFTRRRHPIPKAMAGPGPVLAGGPSRGDQALDAPPRLLAAEEPAGGPSMDGGAAGPLQTPTSDLPPALASYTDVFERVAPRHRVVLAGGVQHVVEEGDTLTRIARRYYRSSAPRVVGAIFAANRSVLGSPDEVPVGLTLRLPEVDGAAPDPPAGDGAEAEMVADASAAPSGGLPSYRTYRVKKGDQLGTIALEQLGSSRRWREILELNRDICPDERHLPYDVEIKIPHHAYADAR